MLRLDSASGNHTSEYRYDGEFGGEDELYDVESYNSLTTDQVVFTVIFTVISYSIINYFICELLVFVIT